MQIHQNKESFAKSVIFQKIKILFSSRIILLIPILIILIIFGLSMFAIGINFDKNKYGPIIKSAIRLNLKIPLNIIKGLTVKTSEQISIDISHKKLQRLYFSNDYAVDNNYGVLNTLDSGSQYVSAKITHNEKETSSKVRVKGNWRDSRSNEKLSLRIKLPNDKTILGMKRFSIHDPAVKSYVSEWLFHRLLSHEGLITPRYDFINVSINGEDKGIFAIEEHFDKRLIESNKRREGVILKLDETNELLSYMQASENQKRNTTIDYGDASYAISPVDTFNKFIVGDQIFNQFTMALSLFESFRKSELPTRKVFDIKQFAKLVALTDLLGGTHHLASRNIKFYFNPITSLIEPIGFDHHWGLNHLNHMFAENRRMLSYTEKILWPEQLFSDTEFFSLYINYLELFSQPKYLEEFYNKIAEDYEEKLYITYKVNPIYEDNNFDILRENQSYIRSKLDPKMLTQAYIQNYNGQQLDLKIGNIYPLPIEIIGIEHKGNLYEVKQPQIWDSKIESEIVEFKDYSFQILDFDINQSDEYPIKLLARIIGGSKVVENDISIWPFLGYQSIINSPLIKETDINSYDFLTIIGNKIIFNTNEVMISEDLVIPKGYRVYINEGTNIDIVKSSSIISFSPISATGSEDSNITIFSSDSSGQGLVIMNTDEKSSFEYVKFTNLSAPIKQQWSLTGSLTFYEADASFRSCMFSDNVLGDDFLNIIRSKFDIHDSIFVNIAADALDSDFSIGTLNNTLFDNVGNDAIDSSNSNLEILKSTMNNIQDKGISAGEDSQVKAENIIINNSNIGIASKDKSLLEVTGLTLENNNIGITAFQKKTEFGPGNIIGSKVIIKDVRTPFLIEESSYCQIDQKIIEPNGHNLKELLYEIKL